MNLVFRRPSASLKGLLPNVKCQNVGPLLGIGENCLLEHTLPKGLIHIALWSSQMCLDRTSQTGLHL